MAAKHVIGGGAVGALAIAVTFITQHEGTKLTAYEDVAGIYTICSGIAYVPKGTTYTQAECDKMTATEVGKKTDAVRALLKVNLTAPTLASHTSFAFNVGINAYKSSSVLKLTNRGQLADGCIAMLKWKKVGNRDCSIEGSGCTGVWTRRKDEEKLCLSGLN